MMKSTPTCDELQTAAVAVTTQESAATTLVDQAAAGSVVEPVPRSPGERWLIRGIAVLVCGLICIAASQTVGYDLFQTVRRLPIFRHVVPIRSADVSASTPDDFIDSSDDDGGSRIRSKHSLAADSMIVPPRSRKSSSKSINDHPLEEDAGPPADALLVENDVVESGSAKMDVGTVQPAGDTDAPVDLTTNLLEAAARLVSLSWQNFDYPVTWSVADTARAKMIFASHRNRLLKGTAHLHPSALSLDLFRKDYATAQAQFPDDPRLDYAFGLVLWKHQQPAEAIEMFQRGRPAGRRSVSPCGTGGRLGPIPESRRSTRLRPTGAHRPPSGCL